MAAWGKRQVSMAIRWAANSLHLVALWPTGKHDLCSSVIDLTIRMRGISVISLCKPSERASPPYEGDSGDLHTWLMLEGDHRPSDPDTVTATPLVRLFKGPLLLELGYNLTANQPLMNFTYRF